MNHTAVTDLDYFVGLGHSERAVREALLLARGDRNTALFYLAKSGASGDRGQLSWRKQSPADWVEGAARAVPTIAENRALHQSPVYVFVQDYYPGDDSEYVFRMQITLKDGCQWMVGRTFPEFHSFYNSLPFGSLRGLTKSFPAPSMFQTMFGDTESKAFLDQRLEGLSEWMRDIVLSETCMNNSKLLELLYAFTDVDKHSGQRPAMAACDPTTAKLSSPLLLETQDSTQAAFVKRKSQYFNQATLLGPEQLPISVSDAPQLLPLKVSVKKLQCYHDLIGIKQSADSKQTEDTVRNEEKSEEDAELLMALAASEAEARELSEEEAQLEAAIQASLASMPPAIELSGERFDDTASPLHLKEQALTSAVGAEETHVTKPSAESMHDESSTAAVPTFCAPPLDHTAVDDAEKADQPLPARVLSKMQSTSMHNLKIDTVQMRKDCSRDRIVVQGKRLDGARTDLEHIYALGRDSILQAMVLAGKQVVVNSPKQTLAKSRSTTNPFDDADSMDEIPSPESGTLARPPMSPVGPKGMLLTDEELAAELHRAELRDMNASLSPAHKHAKNPFEVDDGALSSDGLTNSDHSSSNKNQKPVSALHEDCEHLSRVALSLLSRSESGYLSHASLHEIFDVENTHQAADFTPFFFVPEATLSDPLQLTFTILEKGSGEGSLTQAARGKFAQPALAEEWCVECSGETSTVYRLMDAMSLEPLLQIRVIFQVTLFGMPHCKPNTAGEVVGLSMKEGKCYILIDKVTTTTSRDWTKRT